jgi:hypothetical protein
MYTCIRVSIFLELFFFEKFIENYEFFEKFTINSIKTKEKKITSLVFISEFGNDYKTAY